MKGNVSKAKPGVYGDNYDDSELRSRIGALENNTAWGIIDLTSDNAITSIDKLLASNHLDSYYSGGTSSFKQYRVLYNGGIALLTAFNAEVYSSFYVYTQLLTDDKGQMYYRYGDTGMWQSQWAKCFCPTYHSTPYEDAAETYGIGGTTSYGHVKLADNLTTDMAYGIALSAAQGKILDDKKVDKVTGKTLSSNDFTNLYKTILDCFSYDAETQQLTITAAADCLNINTLNQFIYGIVSKSSVQADGSIQTLGDVVTYDTTFTAANALHRLSEKANVYDVLTKNNTDAFTPTLNYHPATKKYVDDTVSAAGGGDMMKTIYDQNGNGIVDNAEKLGGQLPSYYATAASVSKISLTPPTLTAATPRGTKIGTSGWTGTGFFCTDTNVLYKTEDTNLPNYNSYTRFCLRPADLSDRSYLNWTPYYVSGSTEIEFVWSPARGLYEAIVPIKDGTAEAYISTYITWKYHPPVQIRYGKATNYFNAYDPAGESHDGYTNFTIVKRTKDNIRDFSGMLTKYDYDILACYSAEWNVFENLYDDLNETERSMLILAWDVDGDGFLSDADLLSISKRVINQITTPLPIETIDNFSN